MVKLKFNDNRKQITDDLESRFLDGEKLTREDISREYMPNKKLHQDIIAAQVERWLVAVKLRIKRKYNRKFGCLNELGQFGLPSTEAEYRFLINQKYILTKNITDSASFTVQEAQAQGLLETQVSTRRLSSPVVIDGEPLEELRARAYSNQ